MKKQNKKYEETLLVINKEIFSSNKKNTNAK